MHLRIVLLLATALLAGCADEQKPDCTTDCDLPPVTDTTGLVRGVTVDQAIVPLPNVTLELLQGQTVVATTESDGDGTFVMAELAPGTYTLRASKAGYTSLDLQVQVEAGIARPPVVRVMLEAIPGYDPFVNLFVWQGYIQCNTTYANVCLIINYYPDFLLGTGPITDDESYHTFYEEFVDVARHPDLVQLETVWQSTQALGDKLSIRYQADRPDTLFIDCGYGAGGVRESESPQVFTINATKARQMGIGAPDPDDNTGDSCSAEEANGVGMEFFAGSGLCQPLPVVGCQPRMGVVVEQRTETFVHAFYDMLPPEDWIFVEHGAPPQ